MARVMDKTNDPRKIKDVTRCANGYAGASYVQVHQFRGQRINNTPAYYSNKGDVIEAFRNLSGPDFWQDGIKSWNEIIPGKRPPIRYQHVRVQIEGGAWWRLRVWRTNADTQHVYVAGWDEQDAPHGCGTWVISWQDWQGWLSLLDENSNSKGFDNEPDATPLPTLDPERKAQLEAERAEITARRDALIKEANAKLLLYNQYIEVIDQYLTFAFQVGQTPGVNHDTLDLIEDGDG